MFNVSEHTIFVGLAGSQAHGTARVGSDVDLRGVCVAPLRSRLSLFERFEQAEGPIEGPLWQEILPRLRAHATASRGLGVKTECVIYDVAKFIGLCSAANPNTLEILFTDERDWLVETPAWRRLYEARHLFLTTKVRQTYLGYAMAQLRRIKNHRAWLLNPPKSKPARADFGLPDASTLSRDDQNRIEQAIAEKMRSYGVDDIEMPASTRIEIKERMERFVSDTLSLEVRMGEEGLDGPFRQVSTEALSLPREVRVALDGEKKYRAALKHWQAYQGWQKHRNASRAALESKHGYDTKHAAHLIRLMRTGLETLQSHEIRVRRPDAVELNAIRDGAFSFEQLLEQASELEQRLQKPETECTLPKDIDRARVEALALELMGA